MNPIRDRLPSRPLRNWFLAWHIHTGDSAEVIAQGFDLDPEVVADLVSGDAPLMLDTEVAMEACRMIRVAPDALWPATARPLVESALACDDPWAEMPAHLSEALAGQSRRIGHLRGQ